MSYYIIVYYMLIYHTRTSKGTGRSRPRRSFCSSLLCFFPQVPSCRESIEISIQGGQFKGGDCPVVLLCLFSTETTSFFGISPT